MIDREVDKRKLDKLLNKLILYSTRFIDNSAFPYGLFDLVKHGQKAISLIYDYEYFVLTKRLNHLRPFGIF